ncbi:hypothetical protein PTKIN_Ptkin09bG0041600 [Pterospermum kingtungense]
MANYSSLLSLSVCFLVLFHGCFAKTESEQQSQYQNRCQLQNLNALKPQHRFRSEAGLTEFWDQNEQQFQCARVAFLRHRIQHKGLLLPSFNNAPQLVYVVRGQGIHGAVFPGCPETFQSQSQQGHQQQQQSYKDQHQKIRQIKEGDVLAMPAGVPHWIYNNGQSQLVLVSLIDVGNRANQLDQNFRKFFIAGNPQEGLVRGGQSQGQSRNRKEEEKEEQEQQESGGNNLLSGIDEDILAEVLRIDTRLARKLQNQKDKRGAIVRVDDDFELTSPRKVERQQGQQEEEEGEQEDEDEQEQKGQGQRGGNGIEETFCSLSLKHRTDSSFADVFNPRAGRITSLNSFNFPILQALRLSAERGVLYRNAMYAPHWNMNAHSIVFVTRGSARIQIVSENGDAVFDDQVEEGQVITVPQNYVMVKKAGDKGFEWIAFKTNANARVSQIAGRVSVFRALPVDVMANSFGISREEANRLKQERQEVSLFSPRQGSHSEQ